VLAIGALCLLAIAVAIAWTSRAALLASDPVNAPRPAPIGATLTPKAIAAVSLPATVQIRSIDALGSQRGDATGFFVSNDGLIATSLHVIAGAYVVEAWTLYGKSLGPVRFVAADARQDIALLRVGGGDAHPLSLSQNPDPEIGEQVFVVGNPYGQTGTFTDGLVSALRPAEGITLIQISAPTAPGSSGGPVLNNRGQVIGITALRLIRGQNLSYAIPARYLRELMRAAPAPVTFERRLLPLVRRPQVLAKGLPGRSPQLSDEDAKVNVVDRQFRAGDSAIAVAHGSAVGSTIRDSLAEGDSTERRLTLAKGTEYIVVGYCDDHCQELSLSLIAPSRRVIDTDLEVDYSPKLRVMAPSSGTYRLRVTMSSCDVKRCGFGVRLYSVDTTRAQGLRP
jgi:S1-C subfamily serine protease